MNSILKFIINIFTSIFNSSPSSNNEKEVESSPIEEPKEQVKPLTPKESFEREIMKRLEPWQKEREGYRARAYRCTAGKLTVGWGWNCDASPIPEISQVGDEISRERAQELYHISVSRVFADLDRSLPWWRDLDLPRAAVLHDMCFNMGIGNGNSGLRSFKNTLSHIQHGRYLNASNGIKNSLYARQVGNRGKINAEQIRTGKWQY